MHGYKRIAYGDQPVSYKSQTVLSKTQLHAENRDPNAAQREEEEKKQRHSKSVRF